MRTRDHFRFSFSIETSALRNVRYTLYRPQQVTVHLGDSHNHGQIPFDTIKIMKLRCIAFEHTALLHNELLINIRWKLKPYIWVASIERVLNMGEHLSVVSQ